MTIIRDEIPPASAPTLDLTNVPELVVLKPAQPAVTEQPAVAIAQPAQPAQPIPGAVIHEPMQSTVAAAAAAFNQPPPTEAEITATLNSMAMDQAFQYLPPLNFEAPNLQQTERERLREEFRRLSATVTSLMREVARASESVSALSAYL